MQPNRDNTGDWAGLRQAVSPLGNYGQMTEPIVEYHPLSSWSNMIVKDVRRTGNAEQLRYDDS